MLVETVYIFSVMALAAFALALGLMLTGRLISSGITAIFAMILSWIAMMGWMTAEIPVTQTVQNATGVFTTTVLKRLTDEPALSSLFQGLVTASFGIFAIDVFLLVAGLFEKGEEE